MSSQETTPPTSAEATNEQVGGSELDKDSNQRRALGGAAVSELAFEAESISSIIQELIDEGFLAEAPKLSDEQWRNITRRAAAFANRAPNDRARHIREKFAILQMVKDATIDAVRHPH